MKCDHVSSAGRRCMRDADHDGVHYLEAEPSPEPVAVVKSNPEPVRHRPDSPRDQALEYPDEPDLGRIASALVYFTDTLREHWGMGVGQVRKS